MDLEETLARNDCAGETSNNLTDRPISEGQWEPVRPTESQGYQGSGQSWLEGRESV
jgi:hypothetical protein